MADIAKEAGLAPQEPVLTAASKVFVYLWNVTWENAKGTLDGDADALHDMRVAMRRLRTALQNFEGPKAAPLVAPHLRRELAQHRRKLGKLGDSLGAVRDFDVLADYLTDYQNEHKLAEILTPRKNTSKKKKADALSGLDQLQQYLRDERDAVFPLMVKRIKKGMEPDGIWEQFARFALGVPAVSMPLLPLRGAAQLIIPQRVEEVLAHAPHLSDDHDDFGHHEMRKSLRRLRYSLEILGPCLPEPVGPHLDILVELQDHLGEMQDRSVLRDTVFKAFNINADDVDADDMHVDEANNEDTGSPYDDLELPGDVKEFLIYGQKRRHELLAQARDLWHKQQEQNWPQSLSDLINHR